MQPPCRLNGGLQLKASGQAPSPPPEIFLDKHLSYSANPVQRGGGGRGGSANVFFAGRQGLLSACRLPRRSRGTTSLAPRPGCSVHSAPLGPGPGAGGPFQEQLADTVAAPESALPHESIMSCSHPSREMNGGSVMKVVIFITGSLVRWQEALRRQGRDEVWGE